MALPLVSLCKPEVALSIFQHPRASDIWNTLFTWCFVIMWEWQQFRTHLHSRGCQHAAEYWGQFRAAHILCELLSHFRILWNWFRFWLNYERCRYGLRSLCWAMRWLHTIQAYNIEGCWWQLVLFLHGERSKIGQSFSVWLTRTKEKLVAKSGHRFMWTWPGEAEDAIESRKSSIVSGQRSRPEWDYEEIWWDTYW